MRRSATSRASSFMVRGNAASFLSLRRESAMKCLPRAILAALAVTVAQAVLAQAPGAVQLEDMMDRTARQHPGRQDHDPDSDRRDRAKRAVRCARQAQRAGQGAVRADRGKPATRSSHPSSPMCPRAAMRRRRRTCASRARSPCPTTSSKRRSNPRPTASASMASRTSCSSATTAATRTTSSNPSPGSTSRGPARGARVRAGRVLRHQLRRL